MNTTQAPVIAEPITVVPPALQQRSAAPGRLVVVIPDVEQAALLAGRIHEVARAHEQDVALIGVPSGSVPEVELRRKLALLAAFLQDAGTRAETRFESSPNWLMRLGLSLNDQDLLACRVANDQSSGRQPLTDLLASRFERSVYAFEDVDYDVPPRTNLLARFAPWLASIVVILGFLWVQVQASQHLVGLASTILLLISIPVEIGMILLCNSSFV
jgi:hypothetical protein